MVVYGIKDERYKLSYFSVYESRTASSHDGKLVELQLF